MTSRALATEIVHKLTNAGYTAYFAGGWVRDYLLGHPSEDIDIATDAPPEKILDLFPHTLLIGLSFGIVVVIIDGHQFEVATFRRDMEYVDGRKPTAIELATAEEDALRRDFTINGMFYDPLEDIIYDYVHGKEDLKHKIIRTIGDPYARFTEDRLRMIRAFRFAARFDFTIDFDTREAIRANAPTLFPPVAMERVWNELVKMSTHLHFANTLVDMHRLELLPVIFPTLQGVHLNEIKHRVAPFADFPQDTPTMWFLLELFPDISPGEVKELCTYLKTSKADMELALYLLHVKDAVARETSSVVDLLQWATIYAHPAVQQALVVVGVRLSIEMRKELLEKHQKRILQLQMHIQRIRDKKPLVTGTMLQEQGILPGKKMGLLLKEAERLAIIHDDNDSEAVIEKLKLSPLWKQ